MMGGAANEPMRGGAAILTPREQIIRLVRQILGAPTGSRPLPIDARLSDLGMTSIRMVSLMLAIESEFDVTIPQQEITPSSFESIESVESLIRRLTGSAGEL